MSKAEERALEAYPVKEEWVGNQYGGPEDVNKISREKYTEGYHQAEKDLELSWKDIKEICVQSVLVEIDLGGLVSDERHYTEVLKRFKDFKERKEK